MKYRGSRPDHCWYLIAIALALVIAELLIPSSASERIRLFILGLLAGATSALTDANDRRITHGRREFREPQTLAMPDLLAVGGMTGIALTWICLPMIYFYVTNAGAHYDASLSRLYVDIHAAMVTPLPIGAVNLPLAFIWAGLFTVGFTACVLQVLSTGRGRLYGAFLIPVFVAELLMGKLLFNEPVDGVEWIIVGGVILVTVALVATRPSEVTESAHEEPKGFAFGLLLVGALAFQLGIDASTRASLAQYSEPRQAFVSLAFRALLFSVFGVYVLFWLCARARKTRRGVANTQLTPRAWALASGTGLLFTLTFFLKVPSIAASLAIAPLAFSSASALVFPIACALYGSDGLGSPYSRLCSSFLRHSAGRYLYLVSYLSLALLLTVWCIYKI